MRPFYYSVTENFGDKMNAWLWPELFGSMIDSDMQLRLVGVGSLIKSDLIKVPGKKIIFGTGSGYGSFPKRSVSDLWDVRFVRGPLTAKGLGLAPSKAVVDGAWLIDQIASMKWKGENKSGIVFVPHWQSDLYGNWRYACELAGIEYLSPLEESKSVLRRLATAELVLTESLHGAIIADYYRTPWIAAELRPTTLHFKWHDWCASIEERLTIHQLPPFDLFDSLMMKRNAFGSVGPVNILQEDAPSTFGIDEANSTEAAKSYRRLQKVKSLGRAARSGLTQRLGRLQTLSIYRSLFSKRADQAARLLQNLAKQHPTLSSDSIRSDRLSELELQTHLMRKQYG
jgi:succinoglycan biosynthesis protein ExoV